jgi:hypothetical protein
VRSLSKHVPFSRIVQVLVLGAGALASCRVGYQETDAALAGAASAGSSGDGFGGTPAVAGSTTDGGKSPAGGASVTAGGEDPGGGGGLLGGEAGTSGGGASMGGSAGAGGNGGAGGNSGTSGSSGMGGSGGSPPCTSTTDCTCDEFSGHAYWFCTSELTWDDSETQCESAGMQLVRIDSQAENDFLEDRGFTHGVFDLNGFAQIGTNSRAVAGEWRWVDGTLMWLGGAAGTAVDGAFANWFTASPSASGSKTCAGILLLGTWQDRSCTALVPSICESP